jgi:nitroimidazol reductase NimA-like FMN-containing flavoprotein (pyridoxamine 5'-phosphate oxidase superfamily)
MSDAAAPSPRTSVRRGADRAVYEPDRIRAVLDAGLIAHVGVDTPDGPLVLPMAYGCDDDTMYLHGALANHLLGEGEGQEICATVTLVDGLVMARTPFHNSMNYRCVVVRGRATRVEGSAAKLRALRIITDHVVDNWDNGRPPTASDERRTLVLALPLTEASAKIRSGDPVDEPEDRAGPWWAGVIPVTTTFGPPRTAADHTGGDGVPPAYVALTDSTREEPP